MKEKIPLRDVKNPKHVKCNIVVDGDVYDFAIDYPKSAEPIGMQELCLDIVESVVFLFSGPSETAIEEMLRAKIASEFEGLESVDIRDAQKAVARG